MAVEDSRPEPKVSDDANETADETSEKIEVHVHVHRRGADSSVKTSLRRKKKKRRVRRPSLTGSLLHWQTHYDRILKDTEKPSEAASGEGLSRLTRCPKCDATVPIASGACMRCGSPRPVRVIPRIVAA